MKTRLSKLLNDLNISLQTAIEVLKSAGTAEKDKSYTLNSAVTDEESQVLSQYARSRKKTVYGLKSKQNKAKGNGKSSRIRPSKTMPMTSKRSFYSCFSLFNNELRETKKFAAIKQEMDRVFGEGTLPGDIHLFRTATSNNLIVNYKYYYYSLSGRKTLVKYTCIATWLACIFSEAVNKGLMSKVDYRLFFKNNLWQYIESLKPKKKTKPAKKRQWVSVVSVPFGGMNRR